MVDRTLKTKSPLLRRGQATQEPLYNEMVMRIESASTLTFIDFALNTPAASPADGDTYLVGASPTGVWASNANQIATAYNSSWYFIDPAAGGRWIAFVEDDKEWVAYDQVQDGWYPLHERNNDSGSNVAAEHFTGRYHGTLKRLAKTIDFGTLPNATSKDVAHSITALELSYLRGPKVSGYVGNGTDVYTLGGVQPLIAGLVPVKINATNINITTTANLTSFSAFVRIEYCRTA